MIPSKQSVCSSEAKSLPLSLLREKHIDYVCSLVKSLSGPEYFANEHLRLPGTYWALATLVLLNGRLKDTDPMRLSALDLVNKCRTPSGGFAGNVGHDPSVSSTHYAVLLLSLLCCPVPDPASVSDYVLSFLNPSEGSFSDGESGETNIGFGYEAVATLALLGRLEPLDRGKVTEYIMRCQNSDGGFGAVPGAESHAAYTFCALATLKLLGTISIVKHKVDMWLLSRQTESGGFCGRPNKKADVCCSWWVLAALSILGLDPKCDRESARCFVLQCQDSATGGVGDVPGDRPDVFHTFFAVSALSLIGESDLSLRINPLLVFPDLA